MTATVLRPKVVTLRQLRKDWPSSSRPARSGCR
jgi:hypothetical protein